MAETTQGAGASAPESGLLRERLRGIAGAMRQSEDDLFAERFTGDRGENERNLRAIKARRAVLYEESRQIHGALREIQRGARRAGNGSPHWWQPWKKRPDAAISTIDKRTP
jgi:hypothetical protein